MTTPDFEEWLRQQDFDIEDTATEEYYLKMLADELGISGKSLDIAKDIYHEKYDYLPQLDITPFEWHTIILGETYTETRYSIKGYRGAFGEETMLMLAEEIATERGLTEVAEWIRERRRQE